MAQFKPIHEGMGTVTPLLVCNGAAMNDAKSDFVFACTLKQLEAKGSFLALGHHRPVLVVHEHDRVFALGNRCPHMGFPLDRGSIEDGILTCHWHHARFDLASGCTFDLWADDVPTCPVEVRGEKVWIRPDFGHPDPIGHWRRRLEDGMAHNLGLVIAKAIRQLLAAGVAPVEILRQAALFGVRNRDDGPHGPWQPPSPAAGGRDLSGIM